MQVGDLIQYFSQFAGSFVVGLYLCWELTLVLLSAFPVIAGAGAFMIVAITSFQNESLGTRHVSFIASNRFAFLAFN